MIKEGSFSTTTFNASLNNNIEPVTSVIIPTRDVVTRQLMSESSVKIYMRKATYERGLLNHFIDSLETCYKSMRSGNLTEILPRKLGNIFRTYIDFILMKMYIYN